MKIKPFKPIKSILKPKRGKAFNCFRNGSFTCPTCLSTLRINKEGIYECTGDKLLIWKSKFKTYEMMSQNQKDNYLESLENKERFLELYEKRNNLTCEFSGTSSEIFQPLQNNIPDPIAIKKIEKSLGRELTEQELEEEFIFYTDGEQFKVEEGIELEAFKIPRIKFPEES